MVNECFDYRVEALRVAAEVRPGAASDEFFKYVKPAHICLKEFLLSQFLLLAFGHLPFALLSFWLDTYRLTYLPTQIILCFYI
jgi:hypothetical protein